MTKGGKLQKQQQELNKQWGKISDAIDSIKSISKQYKLTLHRTIRSLEKQQHYISIQLERADEALSYYQQTCPHEKESFIGSSHNWDHYKCNECGREREE